MVSIAGEGGQVVMVARWSKADPLPGMTERKATAKGKSRFFVAALLRMTNLWGSARFKCRSFLSKIYS
jgi:hypothetical protein